MVGSHFTISNGFLFSMAGFSDGTLSVLGLFLPYSGIVPWAYFISYKTKAWSKLVLAVLWLPLHFSFGVSDTSKSWSKTVAPSRASHLVGDTIMASRLSRDTARSPGRRVQSMPHTHTWTRTEERSSEPSVSSAGRTFLDFSRDVMPATTLIKLAYLGRMATKDPGTSFGSLADYRRLGTSGGLVWPNLPRGVSVKDSLPSTVWVLSNF